MKLVSYTYQDELFIGAVRDDHTIVPLNDVAADMLALIGMGDEGLARAREVLDTASEGIPLTDVLLRAPIPVPRRNIMCLGKNYAEHAEESNRAWGDKHDLPQFPIVFTKATTAVNGPYDEIPFDAAISDQIDFEAELAVIIGRAGKGITPEDAFDHIFGYTVMNDVSARDVQRRHVQFFLGKSFDGAAPLGPWIVTGDDLPNPHDLRVTCRVNGETKQDDRTSQMIFDIPETIAVLSRGMTLLPGDIIATGTPSGVGFARTPPEFLKPGDIVECEVESIGVLRNRIA